MLPQILRALACCSALLLGHQEIPERPLAARSGSLSQDFASITSVRELGDGRVLISDARAGQLFVGDFRRDRVEVLGRRGRGPGEYEIPATLVPLSGDSTLMIHGPTRRALLLVGASIVSTLPNAAPELQAGTVLGADRYGLVLVERHPPRRRDPVVLQGVADSVYLVLVSRLTGHGDTIGRARMAETRTERLESNGRVAVRSRPGSPLAVGEPAALSLDSWLVVVRRDPYRVEWRRPDGVWISGPMLPFRPTPVDRRERAATVKYYAEDTGAKEQQPELYTEWPDLYPPIANVRNLLLTASGRVVIRRSRTAGAPQSRYDVVDRRGQLVTRIVLPAGHTFAGFGKTSAYVSFVDPDGVHWLSKHPWPY